MRSLSGTVLFLCLLWVPGTAALAESWSLKNGGAREGEAVAFDYGSKELKLSDPVTGKITTVSTRELSLRSRQRLLLSPLIHGTDRGDHPEPEGRDQRPLYLLAVFAAFIIPGFWLSGWFLTGKANPLFGFMGAVGSWVILGILFTFYSALRVRIDGGTGVIIFGTLVSFVAAPIFVSAVYSCTYLKGILLFAFHLVAAFCLFAITMVLVEPIAGIEQVDAWWSEFIFDPIGLTSINPEEGWPQKTPAPSAT